LTTAAEGLIPATDILERLERRRGQLDSVVITGGEPTLQPGLADFMRAIRKTGFRIKLDTNGSQPSTLAKFFEDRLLDYVAMDVKAPWPRYTELAGVRVDVECMVESMELIAASGIAHEFRTTAVSALLGAEDLSVVRAQIPRGSVYRVLPFRPRYALDVRLRGGATGKPENATQ
jgi:pyruvate formate lyase activating enzyme